MDVEHWLVNFSWGMATYMTFEGVLCSPCDVWLYNDLTDSPVCSTTQTRERQNTAVLKQMPKGARKYTWTSLCSGHLGMCVD